MAQVLRLGRADVWLPEGRRPRIRLHPGRGRGSGVRVWCRAHHPNYSNFTDVRNWNDVGVVVLDRPIKNLPTSPVAGLNTLDAYAQPILNKTLFTAVGYGTEVRKPDSGPQKPTPMDFPLMRRYVEMPGQKLTPQIVAVTSYGLTDNCRYIGGYQRVDIGVVQDWLAGFTH
jgi:hypothetical protein